MANFHRRDSFLKNAGVFDQFLDLNSLPKIPRTVNDKTYTIERGYAGRPDLLADALYDNSRLWWVFALRNPDLIKDPLRDFKEGSEIKVPSMSTIETIIG
jgi:hypothetical protein